MNTLLQLAGGAQHNAPCAVCNVPDKSTTIMIPARLDCPTGWTREYSWLNIKI